MHSPNSKNCKGRCEYLDCVKGLSILCIVFLHFENGVIPQWMNVWIGMFMITAFYFTSGWVFGLKRQVETPEELWSKRLRQLGSPYLWFGLLILLFDLIWFAVGQMPLQVLGREVYKYVTLRGLGTLWFLPVLLGGELLFCVLLNSRKPWLYGSLLVALTYVVSYLYYVKLQPLMSGNTTYQIIDSPIRPIVMALTAWPIIMAGYLMSLRFSLAIRRGKKWVSALCGVILLIVSILFVIAPPFHFPYVNGFIGNTLPVIGFIGIFVLLSSSWVGTFFKYWGKNSLILMCTHFSITLELLMTFDFYVLHQRDFTGPRTIVYFVVCIILTYPMVCLFNKRLSFFLGKQKTIKNA